MIVKSYRGCSGIHLQTFYLPVVKMVFGCGLLRRTVFDKQRFLTYLYSLQHCSCQFIIYIRYAFNSHVHFLITITHQLPIFEVQVFDSRTTSVDAKLLNDGKRLLSCYEDGSVRLWSLKDEKSISIITGAGSSTCLDIHYDLPLAVIGDLMARCYFVNTETAKILRIFTVVEEDTVKLFYR